MQYAIEFFKDQKRLFVFLLVVSLICVVYSVSTGIKGSVILLGIILVFGSILIIYFRPVYGLIIIMACGFFLPLLIKVFSLYDIPITTLIELLNYFLFLILIIKGKLSGYKNFIGILMILWFSFQLIEVLNPNAQSRLGSFFAFRAVLTFFLGYINAYSAITSKRDVYAFLWGWITLGVLAGLYGIYQEYIGLPFYDYAWATSDEFRYKLLYTFGKLRKFSFFTSAAQFGIVMAYSGVACLVMFFFKNLALGTRILLLMLSYLMLASMMFSGTRTAFVLVLAGIIMLAAISLWWRVIVMLVFLGFGALFFMIKPTSIKSFKVMFTAFEGMDDPSLNIRLHNQKILREYIKSKPLGYGLGAIGHYGSKYSPDTFLGSFPPDSELVKIAVESGWIGLIFWLIIMISIFGYGLNVYFSARDHEISSLMVLFLVVFFMILLGQYTQLLFRGAVFVTIFSVVIAIIGKLKVLDEG